MIEDNLKNIKARINSAAKRSGRDVEDIKLLLATKTVEPERIITAIKAGGLLIGENKVQELKEKFQALQPFAPTTHFIGHLQTNKIKTVLQYCNLIETVDRLDLVQKLDKRLQFEGRSFPVFIQINTSYEESKFGLSPENTIPFFKELSKYDTLKVKGLMTIGLFNSDINKVRKCYRLLKKLQQEIIQLNLRNVEMAELSMGMSHDFETAIEEGATIVRIGTAIFGDRIYPDSYYWKEAKTNI